MGRISDALSEGGWVMGLVGLAFTVAAGFMLYWGVSSALNNISQVRNTPLLSYQQMQAAAPGTFALIQGNLSESNRLEFENFIAYTISYYEYDNDDDGGSWVVDEYITPPLLFNVNGEGRPIDRRILIINNDYDMVDTSLTYRPDDRVYEGAVSYDGLQRGDFITALGFVTFRESRPDFEAEWLYPGTIDDYIADQRNTMLVLILMASIFGLTGMGMLLWIVYKILR